MRAVREEAPVTRGASFGLLCLAITSVGWGLNFPIMKNLLTELPPLTSRGLSGLVGACVLALLLYVRGERLAVARAMWLRLAVVSLLTIGSWVAFMGLALLWLPASEAAVLGISIPVWVALLAWPILGERISVLRAIALAIALAALVCAIPFSLMAITDNEIWKEKAYLPGMGAIAAGVLAALAVRRWPQPPRALVVSIGVFGAGGLLALMLAMRELWPLLHDFVMFWLVACAACLVYALAQARGRGVRGLDWLRSMGRYSYEIYLGHMFVVFAIVAAFKASGANLRSGWLWYAPAVLACWALGALVGRWYSDPCARALTQRLARKAVPDAAVLQRLA